MDNSFETLLEHSKQAIRYWWLLLLTGIALFIIGLVVFLYPAQSYLGMSLMFGFLIFFPACSRSFFRPATNTT